MIDPFILKDVEEAIKLAEYSFGNKNSIAAIDASHLRHLLAAITLLEKESAGYKKRAELAEEMCEKQEVTWDRMNEKHWQAYDEVKGELDKTKKEQRAFPLYCGPYDQQNTNGMSLRDYFAGKAMQGWMASFSPAAQTILVVKNTTAIANMAYAVADAMLKCKGEE